MEAAYEEAKKGWDEGGIPNGSVLIYENKIIGRGLREGIDVKFDFVAKHRVAWAVESRPRSAPAAWAWWIQGKRRSGKLAPRVLVLQAALVTPFEELGDNAAISGNQ